MLLIDSSLLQLLKKGNVAVSIEGIDHDTAARKGLSNCLHGGRDIVAAQGQIDFTDDLGSARGRLRLDDRIGGTRVDIVGAHQEERLTSVLE